MQARDVMTCCDLWVCTEQTPAEEVARQMVRRGVSAIPVVDAAWRLVGIVTDRDVSLRIVAENRSPATPAAQIMSRPVHAVEGNADVEQIESAMRRFRVRRLPVVNDDGRLMGFVSLADLARHCYSPWAEHDLVGVLESAWGP